MAGLVSGSRVVRGFSRPFWNLCRKVTTGKPKEIERDILDASLAQIPTHGWIIDAIEGKSLIDIGPSSYPGYRRDPLGLSPGSWQMQRGHYDAVSHAMSHAMDFMISSLDDHEHKRIKRATVVMYRSVQICDKPPRCSRGEACWPDGSTSGIKTLGQRFNSSLAQVLALGATPARIVSDTYSFGGFSKAVFDEIFGRCRYDISGRWYNPLYRGAVLSTHTTAELHMLGSIFLTEDPEPTKRFICKRVDECTHTWRSRSVKHSENLVRATAHGVLNHVTTTPVDTTDLLQLSTQAQLTEYNNWYNPTNKTHF